MRVHKGPDETPQQQDTPIDYLDMTRLLTRAAIDKKAEDLVILDVRGLNSYCDIFIICNGTNNRQVKAIAQHALATLKKEKGLLPVGVEGLTSARWVLVDLGDVVLHVFESSLRPHYDLDGLWVDAPRLTLEDLGLAELAQQMRQSDLPPLSARLR